jgi:DNA-binding LacI/PurR family transcriptional regulator
MVGGARRPKEPTVDQAPTQTDVALAAGVSRGLVSMALADSPRVAEETKARIREAARRLGYVRNLGAASLASSRSPIVGVLLPDLRNPFFDDIVASLQIHADQAGLVVLTATVASEPEREGAVFQRFRELRVAGVVLVTPAADGPSLRAYAEALPTVTIGTLPAGGRVDAVRVDEDRAAALVVNRAADVGARRLIHLSPHLYLADETQAKRQGAMARAAARRGLDFDLVESADAAVARVRAAGPRPPGGFCAVAAHNDMVALDLIAALRRDGYTPGRDVAVLGFDNTFLAAVPGIDLTSVDQKPVELGRLAIDCLIERLNDATAPGAEIVIEPTLTVRSSA